MVEERQDISDPAVLTCLALTHGLGCEGATQMSRILDDLHAGRSLGVKGWPHLFCGEHDDFCPSLPISRAEGQVRIERNTAALESFLQRCFAAP